MNFQCNTFGTAKDQFDALLNRDLQANARCFLLSFYAALLTNLEMDLPVEVDTVAGLLSFEECRSYGYQSKAVEKNE
jgi:hypothetical protein